MLEGWEAGVSHFNTSKVRLEAASSSAISWMMSIFQYLEGAIRGFLLSAEITRKIAFQYLEGAIRGRARRDMLMMPKPISIPRRCD